MALAPLANAQQFQTPTIPNSTFAPAEQFQSRIEHANALKAQMVRAQFEQGAPNEFAEKAFQAQQAYQAERAFAEYSAYMEKHKRELAHASNGATEFQRSTAIPTSATSTDATPTGASTYGEVAQVDFRPPMKRIPSPQQPSVAQAANSSGRMESRPSTFVPPVHVAPTANFTDVVETQTESTSTQSPIVRSVRDTRPATRRDSLPVQDLYSYQPPRPVQQSPPARRQSRQQIAAMSPPRQPVSSYQQPDYVFQENSSIGLQDVISSLLSKKRYSNTSARNTQPASAGSASSIPNSRVEQMAHSRVTEHLAGVSQRPPRSRQPQAMSHVKTRSNQTRSNQTRSNQTRSNQTRSNQTRSNQTRSNQARSNQARSNQAPSNQARLNQARSNERMMTRSRQVPRSVPTHQTRHQPPIVSYQPAAEVQHAIERRDRVVSTMQDRRLVQQVAMVEPIQDPFNDQSVALPPDARLALLPDPQDIYLQTTPRDSVEKPPAFEDDAMRQISVLSSKTQDTGSGQPNQFSPPLRDGATQEPDSGFLPPVQDNASRPQERLENQTVDSLNQLDEELGRRFQEGEDVQGQDTQGDESSRVDQMVEELEKELLKNRAQQNDSGFERKLEERLDVNSDGGNQELVLKTCDEFRNELLKGSIKDISLDMSPLASINHRADAALSRDWTDRAGKIVASGKMVDLRRGYVIVDGTEGEQRIPYAKLSDGDWAVISAFWQIPQLCSVGDQGDATRSWTPQTYTWKASALCHKPLFFEDIQLERYGHSHGPFSQPAYSVAHFFVNFFTVPYNSGIHRATECEYALGFYRPGDCAPWLKNPIPISLSGAARQAVVTSAIAVIP